jgi:lipopolysaccharide/colanic/teichoic acid biosynthesis glycosyltransferase
MTSSIIPTLQNYYNVAQPHQDNRLPHNTTLQWRRGQLLVKFSEQIKQPHLPFLDNEELLVKCLKHSPVSLVRIDPKLGETCLKRWASACEQAHKPIFFRISSGNKLLKRSSQPLNWFLKLIDWIAAFVLLLLVSPVMLVLVVLMQVYSPGSIFASEWHVGERGKLFKSINFCTTAKHKITPLGRWMLKFGLNNLPQLFNVFRGEMSLIGSRSWTLKDAVWLSSEEQKQPSFNCYQLTDILQQVQRTGSHG